MKDFYKELEWRGFIHTSTPGIEKHLAESQVNAYIGFDPTAPSLHVGSLLPIMGLVHLQRAGHIPIAIAGGGTGMVGDPSGKSQERKLLTLEDLAFNLEGIKKQLARFLDFDSKTNPAKLVNNADWLTKLSLMEFLRDVGKYFSINEMLAKDSVKSRLEKEQGMSFTEFSYSILQSYDYLKLFDLFKCTLQMGGSDQWGNITSGIDLIRRLRSAESYAIVYPLITTSGGVKFGKTEGGTIWLDSELTSPYRFYQFWITTDDRDVVKYLKFFTLLQKERIAELEESVKVAPEKREAHRILAQEVTKMLHGESALAQAERATKIFFGGEIADVSEKELLDIFSDVPSVEIGKNQLDGEGIPLIELMVTATVVKSKGEARRAVQGGGIYLNNIRVAEVEKKVLVTDAYHGKFIVLRKGGKNYFLVKII
ncbi:MAG: tyrosine--tRNA ligase [Ignavibacteriales bacterium]|nr:tyrosine--tRNA ligase [Ignavibacteriales bacterium]